MNFFCSKCEKPVFEASVDEIVDGFLFSCLDCGGPIAFATYAELERCPQDYLSLEKEILLNELNNCIKKTNDYIDTLLNIKSLIGGFDDDSEG